MFAINALIICCSLLIGTEAAQPLKKPNKQQVYEFNLQLRRRLTMAHYTDDYRVQHVNYYPVTGLWFLRESDRLQPCHKEYLVTNRSLLADVIQHDGKHNRIIAINDKSPGDPIVVYLGSEVIIRLDNRLGQAAVAMHVHGMHHQNRWYVDGVAMVQQCPIPPRSVYTYRFIADTPGTLWFHGHNGPDRGQGFLGAFIVLTDDDHVQLNDGSRLEPDIQYVMMLQDWPILPMGEILYNYWGFSTKYLYGSDSDRCWAPTKTYDGSSVGGAVPLSAILFNDKGWHDFEAVKNQPYMLPLETFEIETGQNVLFRVINGGNAHGLMVSVEHHKLLVVAADGVPIRARDVDMVIIFPGERYDILVKGAEEPLFTDYYIIAETLEHYNMNWSRTMPNYGIAVLQYTNAVASSMERRPDLEYKHCTASSKCLVLNCAFAIFPSQYNYTCLHASELTALEPAPPEILATRFERNYEEHFLNAHFQSHVNGWRFAFPRAPPYFHNDDELRVVKPCVNPKCTTTVGPETRDTDCFCFHHLNITYGNVVQLVIYNMGNGSQPGQGFSHPLHIHGMHFYVLKMGFPSYHPGTGFEGANNPDIPCNTLKEQCNFLKWTNRSWLGGNVPGLSKNPPLRDTAVLPAGGYIVLRFKADNPGWFFAHCHVIMHQAAGMAFALRIGRHEQMPVPPQNTPKDCGVFEPPPLETQKQQPGSYVSTHVLDTSNGQPAAGLIVSLHRVVFTAQNLISTRETDKNGHVSCMNPDFKLSTGIYKMVFQIEQYFKRLDQQTIYRNAEIYFDVEEDKNYHLPLVLNPFGYSTYLGQHRDLCACDTNDKKQERNRTKTDTNEETENSDGPYRGVISSHIFDTTNGIHASGVKVTLYWQKPNKFEQVNQANSDSSGMIPNLHPNSNLQFGTYKIEIATRKYFSSLKQHSFYSKAEVVINIKDVPQSYLVDVRLSRYAFTTSIILGETNTSISAKGIAAFVITAVCIVCLGIVLVKIRSRSEKIVYSPVLQSRRKLS